MKLPSITELPADREDVYQRESLYNHYLPYAAQLDRESEEWLEEIKLNLSTAVLLRELEPGVIDWMSRLTGYISLYGYKFSKEEHVSFIQLAWKLLLTPDMEPRLLTFIARVLIKLLSKTNLLTPEDLELDWRPLYDIQKQNDERKLLTRNTKNEELDTALTCLTKLCRHYFPPSSTPEILLEFRAYFCPHDIVMNRAVKFCNLYLPTIFLERDESGKWVRQEKPGFRAWLGELMTFWRSCCSNGSVGWEGNLLALMARLAEDNIGLIDWEPELPFMFQRFMYSLDLPVYYKTNDLDLNCNLSSSSISRWIVSTITPSSTTLQHLDIMMNAINSYYHSTSEGRYSMDLVDFLWDTILTFCCRVHKERDDVVERKPHWVPAIPTELKMTDQQIAEFCRIVKPAVMDLTMSESFIGYGGVMLRVLSDIRPDLFLPGLICKFESSLETLTSPHKFTAAVNCLCSVSRVLVRPGHLFPSGPSHIIDILFSVLPGIDCNDIKKTMICLQLINFYTTLVPLTDLSAQAEAEDRLEPSSPEDKVIQQSARLSEFVAEFMEKCFALIESSSLVKTRPEISNSKIEMSGDELSINNSILSSFHSIISQAGESLQDIAIKKMEQFLAGAILEPEISGCMASGMLRQCVWVCPQKVLPALLPHVCSVLKSCLGERDLRSDLYLGDEIMFNLLLLSDMLCCPGCYITPYVPLLEEILQTVLNTRNEDAHSQARQILLCLTQSLSSIRLVELSKIVSTPSPFPLDDWGQWSDLSNLDIKWFIPGQSEYDQVSRLLDNFLDKEVVRLEKFVAGSVVLDKDDLYRSLKTISSIIIGCSGFLRHWEDEEPVSHLETSVQHQPRAQLTGLPREFDFRHRGENTRRGLARLMASLVDKILSEREDDTKALNAIIEVLSGITLEFSLTEESYNSYDSGFHSYKYSLMKLGKREKYIRQILLRRVLLQHQKRLSENTEVTLTRTHSDIISLLVSLGTNHYSGVRREAQEVLNKVVNKYPQVFQYVVTQLLPLLKPGQEVSHQQLKGALHIILSNKLLLRNNLKIQSSLWPALATTEHTGKPSITELLRDIADQIIQADIYPWRSLALSKTNEELSAAARKLCDDPPSEERITECWNKVVAETKQDQADYSTLVSRLCELAEREDSLHWIHYELTLDMLLSLVRRDVALPSRAVTLFTDNLIHDNIKVRARAVLVVQAVLQQSKRKHEKIKLPARELLSDTDQTGSEDEEETLDINRNKTKLIRIERKLAVKPGERLDNAWLQYSSVKRPQDQSSYDEPRYLHKTYFGFYAWPVEDLVYAPSSQQPKLDRSEEEMPESERIIFRFFSEESNVSKLVQFLSMENKKGQDHFDTERFAMFKALFRNFGDSLVSVFRVHIERLVTDHRESHQRAAAELIAGLVRGSKHWTYDKVETLWSWLLPTVRQALTLMAPETIKDWGTSFASSSDNRDPNRLHWLMEVAMEEPIRSQGSFIDSSRLYMLQGVVAQQRWRVGELLSRLLVFLKPFLDHQYHNVRCRLGSVLTNIFSLDVEFEGQGNANLSSPVEREFVQEILPSLLCLGEESQEVTPDQRESALRLLQTLSKWISSSTATSLGPVKGETLRFLPFLLGYEWYDKDPQIARDCQTTLSCLSRTPQPVDNIRIMIEILIKTLASQSWKTRLSCLDFLQAVIFNNFIMFRSPNLADSDTMRRDVISVVLECLKDVQVEVRVKAAQVLGGMIHCQFVSPGENQGIIDQFQLTLETETEDVSKGNDHRQSVSQRHGAVLGLCSVVTAFPHTVPASVPPLLVYLGKFLHDRQPIPATIKKSVQSWKRTHQDNWSQHKLAFTEDQLAEMTDLLVSPSYYA